MTYDNELGCESSNHVKYMKKGYKMPFRGFIQRSALVQKLAQIWMHTYTNILKYIGKLGYTPT